MKKKNKYQLIIALLLVVLIVAISYHLTLHNQTTHAVEAVEESASVDKSVHDMAVSGTNGINHALIQGNYTKPAVDAVGYLQSWNFNNLPSFEQGKYYRETPLADGTLLREYWFFAEDKEIEVAPGIFYPAWTYNGQVPAPTIRATEGDTIKIYFTNHGNKHHTLHFHGFHAAEMDGALPEHSVEKGESFTYEFTAEPAGVHLYHCHSTPLKDHIARGLYGMYIVDPKKPRQNATELVMMMNAFDTNFDGENEIYAVNSLPFYYMQNPIKVKKGELVRIYLANIVEHDPINSFHLHANFFNEYKTGTRETVDAFTDTIQLAQGERSILEIQFNKTGKFMFHSHITEFGDKGWMGMFAVEN